MTTIKKDAYAFAADIEKTKRYYETHSLCSCTYCRNYYVQVKNEFPGLTAFLSEFGVDASRPDEIMSVETEDRIDYIQVDYTVCGSIEAMGQGELDLQDRLPVRMVITDGFVSPNEQTGKYFTISVMNVALPWVLEEPFPQPVPQTGVSNLKTIFQKIFGKRKRQQ